MTTEEFYWLAGILEGEGCFTPARRRGQGSIARIAVTMKDYDVLERCETLIGGYIDGPRIPKNPRHSPTWQWRLDGQVAEILMERIKPLMGQRRQDQINATLVEIYETRVRPRKKSAKPLAAEKLIPQLSTK